MINYKSKLIILRELKLAEILKINKNRIGTTVGHKNIRILYIIFILHLQLQEFYIL